jgi:hypothetical protein
VVHEVREAARACWAEAQEAERWPNDDFSGDPVQTIEMAVRDLSPLHDRETDFALRYAVDGERLAPRPRFLIEAFGEVAHRTVANPQFLDR